MGAFRFGTLWPSVFQPVLDVDAGARALEHHLTLYADIHAPDPVPAKLRLATYGPALCLRCVNVDGTLSCKVRLVSGALARYREERSPDSARGAAS